MYSAQRCRRVLDRIVGAVFLEGQPALRHPGAFEQRIAKMPAHDLAGGNRGGVEPDIVAGFDRRDELAEAVDLRGEFRRDRGVLARRSMHCSAPGTGFARPVPRRAGG